MSKELRDILKNNSRDIVEFTLIYNRNKVKLYNYVLRMVSDRMLAEDIVQTVFLKLFENLNRIRNKNSMVYWIFTTARNEIYTYYRGKKVKVDRFNVLDSEEIEIAGDENLTEAIESNELKEVIFSELDNLPVEQKEVFVLKEYGGFSYKEIGAMMNTNENLVKSRLHKTRQKLITRLSKILEKENYI